MHGATHLPINKLPGQYAICRLAPDERPAPWYASGGFYTISKTETELSIVCQQELVPADVAASREWSLYCIATKLEFELTGILASFSSVLADAEISLFAISTFDTDYFLVQTKDATKAEQVLSQAGYHFIGT